MNNYKILSSEYGSFRNSIVKLFKKRVLKKPSVLLDPMAGTAPLIPFIEMEGHTAYLNDILPLHYFINKAKTYRVFMDYQKKGYDWYFEQLLECMALLEGKVLVMSDNWIDDSILNGLVEAWHATEEYDDESAILLKAIIILCVRPFSSVTKSNNPTWLKFGGISSDKDLGDIIKDSLTKFDGYYRYYYLSHRIKKKGECIFTHLNATELQLPQKVEIILTSPPYCNRLDPIVQYGPENYFLSALGHRSPDESLVTTTKVRNYDRLEADFEYLTANSEFANRLLNKIKKSKADDRSYYLKYYTRYFAKLFEVVIKVLDNLSPSGKMYIVTQDNIHRGNLIEIDTILRELLKQRGWRSRLIKTWNRHHLGLRNVSRKHAFVKPRHFEKLVVLYQ
ncbi:MAG: hypothetical protein NWE91_01890 [Candidatus Bathyarchaeota archaeon]|nr:hypothetical protein [Candidatus Bathyarchaeota archaeon]